MRTRTPRSRSTAESRRKIKVDSDRFISRAMACISGSVNPFASMKTASWLPSSGAEVKTSRVTKERARGIYLDCHKCQNCQNCQKCQKCQKRKKCKRTAIQQ